MKIAVASEQEMVSKHFGHCSNFNIFTVEGEDITQEENVISPGHGENLPKFLAGRGVSVVISGGMGKGAIDSCKENGLEPIMGAEGRAKDVARAYVRGELKSSEDVCREHGHGQKKGGEGKRQHEHKHKHGQEDSKGKCKGKGEGCGGHK